MKTGQIAMYAAIVIFAFILIMRPTQLKWWEDAT